MLFRPGGQRGASHLFFPLEDELHVVAQETFRQHVLEGLQVHEQLSLVVVGATGVDGGLPGDGVLGEHGLERIRPPLVQRLRRLHVIVSIHEDRLLRPGDDLGAEDDRIALRLVDAGLVGAGGEEKFRQPAGAAVHVGLVFGLRADGRDAQEGEELLEEAFAVLVDIGFHLVGVLYKCNKNSSKRAQFRE